MTGPKNALPTEADILREAIGKSDSTIAAA
jgi:hypothetical protein